MIHVIKRGQRQRRDCSAHDHAKQHHLTTLTRQERPMRYVRYTAFAAAALLVVAYTRHCTQSLAKRAARRALFAGLPVMAATALRDGIVSGIFHNTCLSNLPTLSGMSLESYRTTMPRRIWRHIIDSHIDPVSGKPFGYSPITPAGVPLCLVTNVPEEFLHLSHSDIRMYERPYFWLWQPTTLKSGSRRFVLTDQSHLSRKDHNVSWYYQTFIEYLTPEELEQERRYRASHPHLP